MDNDQHIDKQQFDVIQQLMNQGNKWIAYALMVEFGYLCCERGWNLERTLQEFYKLMDGE